MKISIITVCWNSAKTIEDTIKSVLSQTYKNYEYILVDGKSTDNTLKIIKEYKNKFEGRLKYISEKDKGLYDAMNKGVRMSTGDIIGIINSDDILANPYVFQKIIKNIGSNDGIYSDLVFMDEGTMCIPTRNFIAHKYSKHFGWHPPHPTLYLKKHVYDNIGYFNTDYHIAADLDFMMRLINANYKLVYVKDYFVIMRSGGVSTNGLKGYLKNLKEANVVLKKNKIKFPYTINILRILKTFNQGLSAKICKKSIIKKVGVRNE